MNKLCYFFTLITLLAACNEPTKTTKQETSIKVDSNRVNDY